MASIVLFEDAFDAFWRLYPRKTAKKAAYRAWQKLDPGPRLQDTILLALTAQNRARAERPTGLQIPYPATWLNGQRWEDEIEDTLYEGLRQFVAAHESPDHQHRGPGLFTSSPESGPV